MKNLIIVLALMLSTQAHADKVGTVMRYKHSVTNISSSTKTQIMGTLGYPVKQIDIENGALSGTLLFSIGCTPTQSVNVLYVHPGFQKTIPLSLGANDCFSVVGADSTVSTGDASYTFFVAD